MSEGVVAVPVRVVTHEQVIRCAVQYFLEHGTVELEALAGQLAVSRSTLYRMVGSRQELLADVLRWGSSAMLQQVAYRRNPTSAAAAVDCLLEFARDVQEHPTFRRFLKTSPDLALQALFMRKTSEHRQRSIRRLLVDSGALTDWPEAARDDAVFAVARILESTLYADLLGPHQPNVALTRQLLLAALEYPTQ